MKKLIPMMALAAFMFSMNVNAQEKPKETAKKETAASDKKSCSSKEKKGGCCAHKKAAAKA